MNEIIISQIRQRLEILYQMVDELEKSGGGGGEPGTTNYNDLTNKPSVNGHILIGSKTSSDLDLQPVISDLSTIRSGAAAGATAVQPATMNQALRGKQNTLTFDSTPTSGSTNPVTSGGVYTSLTTKVDKVAGKGLSTNDFTNQDKAQISTNKNGIATVANRGSKNQLDVSQTPSTMNAGNITITKGADGSLTLNGTSSSTVSDVLIGRITLPAGDYVLSGCAEGGSGGTWLIRIIGDPSITNASHTAGTVFHTDGITNAQVRIVVGGNKTLTNAVFKPMICTKAEWDASQEFVLYAPTNRELYEGKADRANVITLEQMNGKKNWINVNVTSQTVSTLDFGVNPDNTIIVDGAKPPSSVSLTINEAVQLPQGDYVLLDGSGVSSSALNITLFRNTNQWTGTTATNGKFEFRANGTDTYYCRIYVNTAVDNVTFKPMIITKEAYDAGFTDYTPYAPTNRELYEMILALQ